MVAYNKVKSALLTSIPLYPITPLIRTGSLYPPVVVIDIVFGVEVICEGGMKSHGVSYLIKGHVLLNEAQHHFRGSVKPYSVVLLSLL